MAVRFFILELHLCLLSLTVGNSLRTTVPKLNAPRVSSPRVRYGCWCTLALWYCCCCVCLRCVTESIPLNNRYPPVNSRKCSSGEFFSAFLPDRIASPSSCDRVTISFTPYCLTVLPSIGYSATATDPPQLMVTPGQAPLSTYWRWFQR